jgi:hypothetical protein
MAHKHHEDADPIERELEDLKRSQSKYVNWRELPSICFRVLRQSGKKHRTFWRTVWIHWNVSADSRPGMCIKKQLDEKCYYCEQVAKLMRGDSKDQALAQRMNISRTYSMNVVLVDKHGKTDGQTKILRLSPAQMIEVLKYHNNPEYGDVSSPKKGYTITLDKVVKGKQTRYSGTPGRKTMPVKAEWLENLYNLDEEVARETVTYGQQKKLFLGVAASDVKDGEESPASEVSSEFESGKSGKSGASSSPVASTSSPASSPESSPEPAKKKRHK